MRLKMAEHKALMQRAKAHGLNPKAFTLIKKRGLVHITSQEIDKPFTFFRKKVTRLNEAKQWETQESYFLSLPSKDTPSLSWEEVLGSFEAWLLSGS